MAVTPNRTTRQRGTVLITQTAEMVTAFATLDAADNASDIDFGKMLISFDPGNPAEKQVEEEYNASQDEAMIQVSSKNPPWTPQFVFYDTNGVVTDHGVTNPFDLKAMLEAMRINRIPLTVLASVIYTAGHDVHTYTNLYITRIQGEGLEAGSSGSAKMTVMTRAESRTTALVS